MSSLGLLGSPRLPRVLGTLGPLETEGCSVLGFFFPSGFLPAVGFAVQAWRHVLVFLHALRHGIG